MDYFEREKRKLTENSQEAHRSRECASTYRAERSRYGYTFSLWNIYQGVQA